MSQTRPHDDDARPLDLELLRTVRTVARTHSFSQAGEELGTSQPTISQHIARLKGQLAQTPFVRTTPRVDLAPAGETLLIDA